MSWQPDPARRRIVCSAVLIDDKHGNSFKLLAPRHWGAVMGEQLRQIARHRYPNMSDDELYDYVKDNFRHESQVQGFVDQFGDFHDRREALIIAKRHNQIKPEGKSGNPDSDELFSEDLY
jgi:hypothetical protein